MPGKIAITLERVNPPDYFQLPRHLMRRTWKERVRDWLRRRLMRRIR
jgi:hypothetical protein